MKKWEKFERLVAAINKTTSSGGEVIWNTKLSRRQFDVAIRFRFDTCEHLILFECRDKKRKCTLSEIEAFVTKALDAGADEIVFVSSSGFQSGAINAAKKHNVHIYTLKEINELPPEVVARGLIPAIHIRNIELLGDTEEPVLRLSNYGPRTDFEVKSIKIQNESGSTSIEQIISTVHSELDAKANKEPQRFIVPLQRESIAHVGHTDDKFPVRALAFTYQITLAQQVNTSGLDPSVLPQSYAYQNILTGEGSTHISKDLNLGFDTEFEVGVFYLHPHNKFVYLCEEIEGDTATMFLVESYQHKTLLMARMKFNVDKAVHYVKIKDANEISRLNKIYQKFLSDTGAAT